MSNTQSTLDQLVSSLKQERDELKLKLHLASMDAKDEFDRISGKVDELSAQYDPVSDAVEETAGNIWSALMLAAEEMKAGYGRVRKAIEDSDED